LNPLPQEVKGPLVRFNVKGKKLLIAENDAHGREANFGYSRKDNGTFYNH
jgi:hypothetical protein